MNKFFTRDGYRTYIDKQGREVKLPNGGSSQLSFQPEDYYGADGKQLDLEPGVDYAMARLPEPIPPPPRETPVTMTDAPDGDWPTVNPWLSEWWSVFWVGFALGSSVAVIAGAIIFA